jgi:dienelactone hydrolase
VVLVPDHLGADHRSWFHADALLHAGLDVLVLEPEAERPAAMLDPLFAVLQAARANLGGIGMRHRVGLFGFGPAGEAALLAAFERLAAARAGEDGPRFDGHVALYPTCGADLAGELWAEPASAPTAAPVLIVQPWVEAPTGAGGWNCTGLTGDAAAEGRDERVTLRHYEWTGYGFDLEPTTSRQILPHPTGEGMLVAVPEPGAAELARRDIAAFLRAALGW